MSSEQLLLLTHYAEPAMTDQGRAMSQGYDRVTTHQEKSDNCILVVERVVCYNQGDVVIVRR